MRRELVVSQYGAMLTTCAAGQLWRRFTSKEEGRTMASFGPELGLRQPPPRYWVHTVTDSGGPLELIDGDTLEERLAEALSLGWQVLSVTEVGRGLTGDRTAYVAEPISEAAWQRRHQEKRRRRRREARFSRRYATRARRHELAAMAREIRRMPKGETAELWDLWRSQRQEIARIEAFS